MGEKNLHLVPASSGGARTSFASSYLSEEHRLHKDTEIRFRRTTRKSNAFSDSARSAFASYHGGRHVAPTSPALRLVPPAPPRASTVPSSRLSKPWRANGTTRANVSGLSRGAFRMRLHSRRAGAQGDPRRIAEVSTNDNAGRQAPPRSGPRTARRHRHTHDNEIRTTSRRWVEAALAAFPPDDTPPAWPR